ncbi:MULTISPECIES: NAD(P)H-dependent flavin oxidoreductase [Chromobacterium]|uniref:NAD(P)H-dependent flavin oxidoreductase n=1 Tax=Chromobacterium TaxID=535 RepID=UPI001886E163|nr:MULTISPECIES: nitronate monooxygenase family protein [Chromobacterium]QOZ81627.1 nitronate monooxygenase [Chromobacterium sp. Rain0013]WON85878.1 nitronate monooxygenase family protein [Chromobacterium haemolyticum]
MTTNSPLYAPLQIGQRALLPIVQGGMGIGVSAKSLAGHVAREGALGTVASVDLRHLHADLVEQSQYARGQAELDRLNLIALDREVKGALTYAQGRGMVAVNVMKAVASYPDYVRQACESGAEAVVMGAGLPLDLPEMTSGFPKVALIPILSEARGIGIVLKRWMKKGRLPDAIVIEHPKHAGGHLGAASLAELDAERFSFQKVLDETRQLFKSLQLESERIPLIVAGGVNSFEKMKACIQDFGASAVQIGTAFAVTREGDAHDNFKRTLAEAKPEDIAEFMSVAGLPARGVLTPFLKSYLKRETILQANAKADPARCTQSLNCLSACGLRDGVAKMGQFCIDLKLAAAFRGEVSKGLFFRGADPLPFGDAMRSVSETIRYFLTGEKPADIAGA